MGIEIRVPTGEEELRAGMRAAGVAFGEELKEVDLAREVKSLPADRALVAFDGGNAVGLAGAYPFELTVPGAQLTCGGVTWVGVMPTHRRRGILREFMTRQLRDLHEWEEPVAILYASEAPIYGRFGYGTAAPMVLVNAERARFAFRDDPGASGAVRLVDADAAYELIRPVHEHVRQRRAGMLSRTERWWREHRLADHEHWRDGASPKYYAVLEFDGAPAGYALYRIKEDWNEGFPRSQVLVIEALAISPEATRELWRFLVSIDLTARVRAWKTDPGFSLFLMLVDPRTLDVKTHDGVWLRLVDVEAALAARSYEPGEPLVIEVRDELCEWNAGRYRVGEGAERTDAAAELAVDVADLARAYLGAFTFDQLASAGRVEELREGAIARASSLFRTPLPPLCVEDF